VAKCAWFKRLLLDNAKSISMSFCALEELAGSKASPRLSVHWRSLQVQKHLPVFLCTGGACRFKSISLSFCALEKLAGSPWRHVAKCAWFKRLLLDNAKSISMSFCALEELAGSKASPCLSVHWRSLQVPPGATRQNVRGSNVFSLTTLKASPCLSVHWRSEELAGFFLVPKWLWTSDLMLQMISLELIVSLEP